MDEKAFEHIACRLRERALWQARRFGLGDADAEDIAQDVMLRLWQLRTDLDRFRSPEAFTLTVARRMVLNTFRRQRLDTVDAQLLNTCSPSGDPQSDLETREDEEWLAARIERLPATWHTILYMRQVERRSGKEIAALLGIQEPTVRTLLSRARKTLFDEMKKRR